MRRLLALLAAAPLVAAVGTATAGAPDDAASAATPGSKKQAYLAAKEHSSEPDPESHARELERWDEHLRHLLGRAPDAVINIYHGWTHETLPVTADQPPGKGDRIPQPVIDRFFRCRWTNRITDMAPELFPTLVSAANHFHVRRVFVISGFRSPKFNLMLRKKGHQVGRESQHTFGKAVDFRLPGVPTRQLRKWAKSLRLGGVGFYPKSKMIHIDTSRVRYWEGD